MYDATSLVHCGFFTPPVAGALLRAALVANCFLGALPPVDLRAVCFVRAMITIRAEPSFIMSRLPVPGLRERRAGPVGGRGVPGLLAGEACRAFWRERRAGPVGGRGVPGYC